MTKTNRRLWPVSKIKGIRWRRRRTIATPAIAERESDPCDHANNVIGPHDLPVAKGDEKLKLYPCTCGIVCTAPPCFKCSQLTGVPMANVDSLQPGSRYDKPMVIAVCTILSIGVLYIGWSMQRGDAARAPAIGMMEAS